MKCSLQEVMANPYSTTDELLEAYRDGQLDSVERQRLDTLLEADAELSKQLQLGDRIDDSLKRIFAPPPADLSFLNKSRLDASLFEDATRTSEASIASEATGTIDDAEGETLVDVSRQTSPGLASPGSASRTSRRKTLYLAIAASIAWVAVAGQLFWPSRAQEVAFQQRPLTELYQRCVAEGFQPYWVCDDDMLFAATFERRQGVPLQLNEMPDGKRMVGLSYLAGISRKSTSLLGMVDETPVVVFIDRIERDWKPPTGSFPEVGLNVVRTEREGLVFYEVSPLEEVQFVEHFVRSDS